MDNATEGDRHPAKRRRYFAGSSPGRSPPAEHSDPILPSTPQREIHGYHPLNSYPNHAASLHDADPEAVEASEHHGGESISGHMAGLGLKLDTEMLQGVVGPLEPDVLRRLDDISAGDLQRAINMYLDGSWQKEEARPSVPQPRKSSAFSSLMTNGNGKRKSFANGGQSSSSAISGGVSDEEMLRLDRMPRERYIGSLGVDGWATRGGRHLIAPGEEVLIERQQPQIPAKTKKGKARGGAAAPQAASKRKDTVVRFSNSRGEEVGRLQSDKSHYLSTLIDQKICSFKASCVWAPESLRTGETVYIQLRCFMIREAFNPRLIQLADTNRTTGLFEAKETEEERALRLRQTALVNLFNEIKLYPTAAGQDSGAKRTGLLQAAEMAEEKENQNAASKPIAPTKPRNKDKDAEGDDVEDEDDPPQDGKELEQDQLDQLYKKAQSFDFDSPEAEPASSFAMDLRRYQKQALHWMLNKERDKKNEGQEESMHPLWEEYTWPLTDEKDQTLPIVENQAKFYVNPYSGQLSLKFPVQEQNCLGGILADEMGLGKTIQMLSLIHTNRTEPPTSSSKTTSKSLNLVNLPKASDSVEPAPYTTLVVAPMSLLAQWHSEANVASKPGTLKALIYYGAEKALDLRALCSAANHLNAPNVIITSYGTVLSEYNIVARTFGGLRGGSSGLFSVRFHRVILDEGHNIKNRQSKTAKACYELDATHRWVLTGTPIVNRLEDLFSLVRFLRVEPWSNFAFWRTFITVPFESKDFLRALDVVQTVLEPLVMRRTKDMKQPDGTPLVKLPPKTIILEEIELSQAERAVYDFIYMYVKRSFAENVEHGSVMKSYTTIFAQILRLRQSCCHPTLVRKKELVADEVEADAAGADAMGLADNMDLQALIDKFTAEENEADLNNYNAHILQQIQQNVDSECPICSDEPMQDMTVTACYHMACKQCLLNLIAYAKANNQQAKCFSCREPISEKELYEVIRHDDDGSERPTGGLDGFAENKPQISLERIAARKSSAKIDALIANLRRLRKEHPGMKSVVFSQFTSFLSLIEPALKRERIKFARFDGSMTQQSRASILEQFKAHSGTMVLLISLKAGGVGLNLTEAKRVFMMDPWWSFAVEAQAIDRIHRMGQTDEVVVHRFIAKGSVEERMVHKIQERKKFIASSLGMMSAEEKRAQRIEDIRDLLS